MSTREAFVAQLERKKGRILGEFENRHGEPFVVYLLPPLQLFLTGSELDWSFGLHAVNPAGDCIALDTRHGVILEDEERAAVRLLLSGAAAGHA